MTMTTFSNVVDSTTQKESNCLTNDQIQEIFAQDGCVYFVELSTEGKIESMHKVFKDGYSEMTSKVNFKKMWDYKQWNGCGFIKYFASEYDIGKYFNN